LTERVGRLQPGDKIKITASRNNVEKDLCVTLKADAGISNTLANQSPGTV
jgi:hypothetical protein